jgi:hypothetical protein
MKLKTVPQAKTLRFAALVEKSGAPEIVTLWQDPESDKAFSKAIKENRVLTVKQPPTGTRKDFGVIGFFREVNASYFVFPKTLSYAEGTKVIGIKYELAQTSEPPDPIRAPIRPERRERVAPRSKERFDHARKSAPAPAPKPRRPTFRVQVRRQFTDVHEYVLEATNLSLAKKEALRRAQRAPLPDAAEAEFEFKVTRAREVR